MGSGSSKSKPTDWTTSADDFKLIKYWKKRETKLLEDVPCGKRTVLFGLDGAGKSTLLHNALKLRPELFSLEAYPYKTDPATGQKSLFIRKLRSDHTPWSGYRHIHVTIPTIGFVVESTFWNDCYNPTDTDSTSGILQSLTAAISATPVSPHLFEMTSWNVGGSDRLRPLWRHFSTNAVGLIFMIDSTDVCRFEDAKIEMMYMCEEPQVSGLPLLILLNKSEMASALSKHSCMESLGLKETVPFKVRHVSEALTHTHIGDECNNELKQHLAALITSFCLGEKQFTDGFELVGESALKRPVKVCSVSCDSWHGIDEALQWLFAQCSVITPH